MDEKILMSLIVLLLGGNAYFIKRLIEKIDLASETARDAGKAVAEQQKVLDKIEKRVEELRTMEIDVSIISSLMKNRPSRKVYKSAKA